MMNAFWSLYWQLHAELQSGYIHFGVDRIGYTTAVLEASHYGDWATRYPGDPSLPARYDKMRNDFTTIQSWSDTRITLPGNYHVAAPPLAALQRKNHTWSLVDVPPLALLCALSNKASLATVLWTFFVLALGATGGFVMGRSVTFKQQPL